jgi:two-component system KDP operon response regulator KdpE
MTSKKILFIDDDETLLSLLAEHFQMVGYSPLTAINGQIGLELVIQNDPDIVILDVMMPGMDGWQVCEHMRKNSSIPIIMLTAKGDEIDKLRGFQLGVDDYVTKPFSFAELVARANAVLSRSQSTADPGNQVTSGDLQVDFDQHRVTNAGQVVDLSPTEYRLLETLSRHAYRTVPTEQILTDVWGSEYKGEIEHVKRYIWSLRKKLEADPGNPQHILTERGFGYRFE